MKKIILLTFILLVLVTNASDVAEADSETPTIETVVPVEEVMDDSPVELVEKVVEPAGVEKVSTVNASDKTLAIYFILLLAILVCVLALASIIPPPRSRKQ